MAVVVIGQFLVAGAVILTGLMGAEWHVGFPMWNRVIHSQRRLSRETDKFIDDLGNESLDIPIV
jgi:hypothetical protein